MVRENDWSVHVLQNFSIFGFHTSDESQVMVHVNVAAEYLNNSSRLQLRKRVEALQGCVPKFDVKSL